MPLTRGIRINLKELSDFIGSELPDAIDDFKYELMDLVENSAVPFAKDYARRVMPSGGGSYIDSIKWQYEVYEGNIGPPIRTARKDELGILYSDHEWAEAIEKGTRGHPIPKEGGKVVGGVGYRVAKQEAEKRGWKIPKEMIPTKPQKNVYMSIITEAGGTYDPGTAENPKWPGSIEYATERRVYEDVINPRTGNVVGRRLVETKKRTKAEIQATMAHEGTHGFEHYQDIAGWTRGIDISAPKSRKEYKARPHEKRTYETGRKARREVGRIMRGEAKEGIMVIEPKLAKRGTRGEKGKIPRASRVPRGTKYGTEKNFAKRVMHPGARPFRIFENTSRFIHRNLHKWMNIALDRVGFR